MGRTFTIDIVKCSQRDDCKSEAEIIAYFEAKFMLVMRNNILFD